MEVWKFRGLDRPHAARLSQRTRRTTVQARSAKPSTAKGHKGLGDWLIGGALCAPEVWRLRGLEAWPLRLTPLCRTVCLPPRRGAPVSPASPASPDPGRVRVSAPSQSVACEARHAPTGPRAGRAPLVEVWKLRGLEAWLFQRLARRACRAFCSPWPWKFWRFAPARSVLRGVSAPLVLRVLRDSRAAFGLIAAKGGGPGSNLCGSSKPPSLQTSKLPWSVLPAAAGP